MLTQPAIPILLGWTSSPRFEPRSHSCVWVFMWCLLLRLRTRTQNMGLSRVLINKNWTKTGKKGKRNEENWRERVAKGTYRCWQNPAANWKVFQFSSVALQSPLQPRDTLFLTYSSIHPPTRLFSTTFNNNT